MEMELEFHVHSPLPTPRRQRSGWESRPVRRFYRLPVCMAYVRHALLPTQPIEMTGMLSKDEVPQGE